MVCVCLVAHQHVGVLRAAALHVHDMLIPHRENTQH